FRLEHRTEVRVTALRRKPERSGGAARPVRRRREDPGDEFVAIIQPGGDAVNRADECAFAAADHAEPDSRGRSLRNVFDSHASYPCDWLDAEHASDLRLVGGGAGEIIERLIGDTEDVIRDESRTLAGTVFGILQAAFPFQNGPRVIADRC